MPAPPYPYSNSKKVVEDNQTILFLGLTVSFDNLQDKLNSG